VNQQAVAVYTNATRSTHIHPADFHDFVLRLMQHIEAGEVEAVVSTHYERLEGASRHPTWSNPMEDTRKMMFAYTVTERGDRTFWTKIGVAFTNRDGSINVKLDAIPVSGTLCLRVAKANENPQ
jgi:uncharacterized protein (DUF2249 family)